MDRATQINQLHENFCEGVRTTVPIAIQIGEERVAQKENAITATGSWIMQTRISPAVGANMIRC
jgi:hypothetical protein